MTLFDAISNIIVVGFLGAGAVVFGLGLIAWFKARRKQYRGQQLTDSEYSLVQFYNFFLGAWASIAAIITLAALIVAVTQ